MTADAAYAKQKKYNIRCREADVEMKYALIGCGRVSVNHIAAALNCGFEVTALCDVDLKAAQCLVEEFSLKEVRIYESYQQMLEKETLDVVSIATPSGIHAEIAVACCEHGVNVLVEKPIALSVADAQRIEKAAKDNGVKATVCFQNRYNKAVAKAMELVKAGALGELYCVNANVLWSRDESYFAQGAWRGTWAQDGGVLMNQSIHNIDLFRWFAGSEVESVTSMIGNVMHPYIEAEDVAVAIVKFQNGCLGTINCTSNIYRDDLEETLYIMGSKGTIKLGGKAVNQIEVLDVAGIDNVEELIKENSNDPPSVYGFGHTPLFAGFKRAIEENTEPFIPLREGARSLELVLGIYKSAKEKNSVRFPLASFSTLDMEGYNYRA